jgi:tagatose-1,6-bisphosphate aldolase non-catalytic subunit AgaZ/GatZ
MAALHYAYNMMKIQGPKGLIAIHGDPDAALECEDEGAQMADAVIASKVDTANELAKISSGVDHNDPTILKKPTRASPSVATFEASKDTTKIDLVEGDSSK